MKQARNGGDDLGPLLLLVRTSNTASFDAVRPVAFSRFLCNASHCFSWMRRERDPARSCIMVSVAAAAPFERGGCTHQTADRRCCRYESEAWGRWRRAASSPR